MSYGPIAWEWLMTHPGVFIFACWAIVGIGLFYILYPVKTTPGAHQPVSNQQSPADIDVGQLERNVKELAKALDEVKALSIGIAAVVANLPELEKVAASQAKQTASQLIGSGPNASLLSSAGKMISAICENAKVTAASRSLELHSTSKKSDEGSQSAKPAEA